jgi:hypothetical protein
MRFGVPVFEFESHHDEGHRRLRQPGDQGVLRRDPVPGSRRDLTSKVVFYKQGSPGRVVLFSLDRSTTTPQIVGNPDHDGRRAARRSGGPIS